MVTISKTFDKLLLRLFKDSFSIHTATSLAESLGVSRWGIWKTLKRLESEQLITLIKTGSGRTSTYSVELRWKSELLHASITLLLTKEAMEYGRWRANFRELSLCTDFLILFGSILHSPKLANDIDLLAVISKKRNFVKAGNIVDKIQKTQVKRIHAVSFKPDELSFELKKPNKAFIDAVKKGIILFGQENSFKLIKELHAK